MSKANIFDGKYLEDDIYLIDTEGGTDTDQIYAKIPQHSIQFKYLFRYFYDQLFLTGNEIQVLIDEIEIYLSDPKNLEIFDRPQEVVDYLNKIKEILKIPLENNWTAQLEVN